MIALLLLAFAPLPFPKAFPGPGTYETPHGYVAHLTPDGRVSYGRGYLPGVSVLEGRWGRGDDGTVWIEAYDRRNYFAPAELRRIK